MTKCLGCGAVLQSEFKNKEGYVKDIIKPFCERCFRINHYNDYKKIKKSNTYYLDIIKQIETTKDLVLVIVDFLNTDLKLLNLTNPVLLILAKKDLLPKGVDEKKILNKIDSNLNIVYKIVIGSKNNYNLDLLWEKINFYKKSNNVYVVGYTNTGKSTLINKLAYNYENKKSNITTSNLPSTTLDLIKTEINGLNIIDTPGLLDDGSIILSSDKEQLNKIIPKNEIKPITFQIKDKQSIVIENIVRIDVKNSNLIFYISNKLNIKRYYKENDKLCNLNKYQIKVKKDNDLVIKGLGFIKTTKDCEITLYLDKKVKYFVRQSLI